MMGALTHTRQGNGYTSIWSSPCKHGHGCGFSRGGKSSHPDSHNGRGSPGQKTKACNLLIECVGEDVGRRSSKQGNQEPSARGEGAAGSRNPLSAVLQVQGVGPHCQGLPYPGIHFKPAQGEVRECCPPQLATAAPGNNKPLIF